MTSASEEAIAAATAYEALHVPALFAEWAPHVVDAAHVRAGDRVLDVACGTGVVARAAASRVAPDGSVTGVDANPGMLVVAERLAPRLRWQHGAAESLPFDDDAFDVVLCQFGLMFFRDRRAALRDMTRVLTPGGRMAVAVWESLERSEAYSIEVELLERMAGPAAADALRAPFVLGDRTELADLVRSAGVESVTVTTRRGTARFPSVRTMVEADLRGWLPLVGVILPEDLIQRILAEAERALGRYVTPAGTVEFGAPAHVVSGRKA